MVHSTVFLKCDINNLRFDRWKLYGDSEQEMTRYSCQELEVLSLPCAFDGLRTLLSVTGML